MIEHFPVVRMTDGSYRARQVSFGDIVAEEFFETREEADAWIEARDEASSTYETRYSDLGAREFIVADYQEHRLTH